MDKHRLTNGEATGTVAFMADVPIKHIEYWALVVINKAGTERERIIVASTCEHAEHATRCLLEGITTIWGSQENREE